MNAEWSVRQCIAFRFAFIYIGLYELPWAMKRPLLPDWRKSAESLGSLESAVRWFGHHVLGTAGAMVKEYPAGLDTSFQWVRVAFLGLVALFGTTAWSVLDRRRRAYPLLLDALCVYVRYGLAFTMLFYGAVKVFPIQFAPSTLLNNLLEPFGELSPMGLLWKFMGFSRPYTFFSGLVEAVGGVFLFWRRTTFLGALLVAAATANVFLLNLSYDVPVKLYSAHLLLMALFLAAPDGWCVLRAVVRREPVTLPPLRESLPWAPVNRVRPWLKTIVVLWCSFATVYFTVKQSAASQAPERPALYGAWLVESSGPGVAEGTTWHHVVIDEWGKMTVERMDDERTRFDLKDDPSTSTLALSNKTKQLVLSYVRPDPDHLLFDGDLDGRHVSLRLRRVHKEFLLTTRGFHFVQEEPLIR
jgi:hypothetical protein